MPGYPFHDPQLQAELLELAKTGVEHATIGVSLNGKAIHQYSVPTAIAVPFQEQPEWQVLSIPDIAQRVAALVERGLGDGSGKTDAQSRHVILVEGDAGSGKTTFAKALASALPSAALIHVDDISWWLDWLDWSDAMLDGIVRPWLAGERVDYRPPGWIDKGRAGSVTAPVYPVGAAEGQAERYLVIEGMAAGRPELEAVASLLVFVTSDPVIARERLLGRDTGTTRDDATAGTSRAEEYAFYAESQQILVPFILNQQPWSRAELIVDGTATTPAGTYRVSFKP